MNLLTCEDSWWLEEDAAALEELEEDAVTLEGLEEERSKEEGLEHDHDKVKALNTMTLLELKSHHDSSSDTSYFSSLPTPFFFYCNVPFFPIVTALHCIVRL